MDCMPTPSLSLSLSLSGEGAALTPLWMGQARTPWSTRAADSKDTLIMLQSRTHFPTRRVGKPATLPLSFAQTSRRKDNSTATCKC